MVADAHSPAMSGWARFVGLVKGFACAVAAGTLVGAAPFLAVAFPFGLLLSLPAILSILVVVLACSICVGLPLTLVASRLKKENSTFYGVAGGVSGLLVVFTLYVPRSSTSAIDTFGLFVLMAAAAGGVTGFVWGAFRERYAKAD